MCVGGSKVASNFVKKNSQSKEKWWQRILFSQHFFLMALKETSKLNWILPKLSQNASVHCSDLFMLSSLWTDTLSLVALMWVSSVFWALLSMPRSLRSPLCTVPMDSRPRGPHSDMCLGGFTPHFYSPSEVLSPSRNPDEKHPSKQTF